MSRRHPGCRDSVGIWLRIKAAWHELFDAECRVTWKSWLQRLVGDGRGYAPLPSAQMLRKTDA